MLITKRLHECKMFKKKTTFNKLLTLVKTSEVLLLKQSRCGAPLNFNHSTNIEIDSIVIEYGRFSTAMKPIHYLGA